MHKANDAYSRITNKIIADLEKGSLTWRKPWDSDCLAGNITRPLRWNDAPYNGINIVMLWATGAEMGYTSPYWMTFNQVTELKASVKKGEKATLVVYADKIVKEEEKPDGEISLKQIPFLKGYNVFNANQITGLPEKYYQLPEPKQVEPKSRIEELESFFAATKADITVGGYQACYNIGVDRVYMPPFESFYEPERYYATLAHELTHWTRHPNRLDRKFGRKKWGDEGYAKEELVAELGACFLASDLNILPENSEDPAAYIQSWLSVLKNDKHFIFTAASYAQKAVEYIHQQVKPILQPIPEGL